MKPEDVGYITSLDIDYVEALQRINPNDTSPAVCDQFQGLLDRWAYWLDDATKILKGKDWVWLAPLVADCKKESVVAEKKHDPAIALTMPGRIFRISIIANQFKAPWGCAYIRLKEEGKIDY